MNKTDHATQAMILRCLTDGMGVRATCRATGVSKGTVLRLLEQVGDSCATYHCLRMRELPTQKVQADEQWSFVGAKQRHATRPGDGDLWTFAALDADTKLVISYLETGGGFVQLGNEHVQGRPEVVNYVANNGPHSRGRVGANLQSKGDLPRLRLVLTDNAIGVSLEEGSVGRYKLVDVVFGPFDLDPATGGPIAHLRGGR
jgi:hypothetical protein